jgi:nickel transport protein
MKSILMTMCCSAMIICTASLCRAHGVDGAVERIDGYCVTAQYDDSEPMSYAGVEIKAPDSKIGFQNGRTDRNGCFMFHPDVPGVWRINVQDGMGHRLALDVTVGENPVTTEKVNAGMLTVYKVTDRFWNIVSGLAVIFGLCGLFYARRARSSR